MWKVKQTSQERKKFSRDANGSAMIFVVLVMFTLVCFFVFTIHVGQRITDRVEMQNAADAAAITCAVWKARGLNLISVLNVSMSECLAMIIMFKAFDSTLTYTKAAHKVNISIATACSSNPYTGAFCAAWLAVLNSYHPVIAAYTYANNIMKRAWKSPKILWKVMSGLKKVSQGVSYATAIVSYLDANRIAKRNDADDFGQAGIHAFVWPVQYELPVEEGSFEEDLCSHTWNGGDGYTNYLCYDDAFDVDVAGIEIDATIEAMWLALSAIVIPAPPIVMYELFKKAHYSELCSSSSSSVDEDMTFQESTLECGKCRDERGESRWEGYRIELTRNECDDQWTKEGSQRTRLPSETYANGQRPQGNLLANGSDGDSGSGSVDPNNPPGPCRVCNNLQAQAPEEEGQPTRYFADIWLLQSCTYESDEEVEIDYGNHDDDKVKPLVLVDNWKDRMKYTSLVVKRSHQVPNAHFLGSDGEPILSLKSDMSGEMITYGQDGNSKLNGGEVWISNETYVTARAVVYNPGQEDLFNQNWHAKLAPVDIKGIPTEFLGVEIQLPDFITDLANAAFEEVLLH